MAPFTQLATHNDVEGLEATGRNRSINRKKLRCDELEVTDRPQDLELASLNLLADEPWVDLRSWLYHSPE